MWIDANRTLLPKNNHSSSYMYNSLPKFVSVLLLALALPWSGSAQLECAPLWLSVDASAYPDSTLEEAYFWVTPLNGLTVISAEGTLSFEEGSVVSTPEQMCLAEGCYFLGLNDPALATWWPALETVTDDLTWAISEPEPMEFNDPSAGFTFCVENNVTSCEVSLAAELGVGPNAPYVFTATTDASDVTFSWSVSGSVVEGEDGSTFEWFDLLGAPWWEVCVTITTVDGCSAQDCVDAGSLNGGCIDESLIDPNVGCLAIWAPVCGCDGVTYSNECSATHYGGVTEFTMGECQGQTGLTEVFSPAVIKVFPNPATEVVVFSGWGLEPARLVLRNMLGQRVVEVPRVYPNQALDLPSSLRGAFQAELIGNGWTAHQTLVVN